MIQSNKGLEDNYFTWISTEYALPADDVNKIVTVRDRAGVYVDLGFYDGTGWYGYDGRKLDEGDRSVIAWVLVSPAYGIRKDSTKVEKEEA